MCSLKENAGRFSTVENTKSQVKDTILMLIMLFDHDIRCHGKKINGLLFKFNIRLTERKTKRETFRFRNG